MFYCLEIRRLNRCRIFVGYCGKASRTWGINAAADSDVEFLSNLIRWIEFETAEMRRMNWASVYKSCAFASPGQHCSQPLEHCNKEQLTKETHSVSETGVAKLNKQFFFFFFAHSKRRSSCRQSRRYWQQSFICSNTLQAYRNVSIYALLFKSPSQC